MCVVKSCCLKNNVMDTTLIFEREYDIKWFAIARSKKQCKCKVRGEMKKKSAMKGQKRRGKAKTASS